MKFKSFVFPFFALVVSAFSFTSCDKNNDDDQYYGALVIENADPLPDLADNTVINGNLLISFPNGDKPDLSELEKVVEVTGTLQIEEGVSEDDLFFLRNIQETGTLIIDSNLEIGSLEQLDKIKINQHFFLNETNVESIPDFPMTTELQGDLSVTSNQMLTHANGFANLKSIKGNVFIGNDDNIQAVGFQSLESIEGRLVFHTNAKIEALDFPVLLTVDGDFNITDNDVISNLDGFTVLEAIGAQLILEGNAKLESIEGLNTLKQLKEVGIVSNQLLADFCPLYQAFQEIEPILYIVQNNAENPTVQDILDNCQG
ncbi:MAG: hypothetical protein GYB31_17565 [Bacteroidetes bacterium]|nr:hypothetical protein [Bacteroidota bacterium]